MMKKTRDRILIAVTAAALLAGCGGAKTQETTGAEEPQVQTADAAGSSDDVATLPDLTETRPVANPPSVMIDGTLYQDTGYLSSMMGCGNMDGSITSSVEAVEMPSEDQQSNFGTGYEYQFGSADTVIVYWEDEPHIFRNVDSADTSIPPEVFHFTGEVEEVNDGSLLVKYLSTAEGFRAMSEGEYVVSTDNLQEQVQPGDTVEVWFNGAIQETDPAQIGLAYRIEKVK